MGNVQIKNLYVNGCSWTDGDTLDLAGLTPAGTGRTYSYPTLLANKFKYNLIDDSRYGGSISRIVRMCWDYISKNDISSTMFILEIPNGFRDEIYSNKISRYFNITSGSLHNDLDQTENNYEWREIKNDVVNTYLNFCNFGEFAKKEYLNLMGLISYIKTYTDNIYLIQPYDVLNKYGLFTNLITKSNIIKLSDPSFKKAEYLLIQDMCKFENLSLGDELNNGTEDTHPGISGHYKIYEIILNHLTNNESNLI
jgi:hypothetical protein